MKSTTAYALLLGTGLVLLFANAAKVYTDNGQSSEQTNRATRVASAQVKGTPDGKPNIVFIRLC